MSDPFDMRRVLRLDGESPTPCERWRAFYSLWRRIKPEEYPEEGGYLKDCFYILMWRSPMLRCVTAPADSLGNRRNWPAFIRRHRVEMDRRRRIYGNDYDTWHPRDQAIAQELAGAQGIELTPEEVGEARVRAFRKIREEAARRGLPLPESDEGLAKLIAKANRKGENS